MVKIVYDWNKTKFVFKVIIFQETLSITSECFKISILDPIDSNF